MDWLLCPPPQATTSEREELDDSMVSVLERFDRCDIIVNGNKKQRAVWEARLALLSRRKKCVLGDSILAASAALQLCGQYGQHRRQAVASF